MTPPSPFLFFSVVSSLLHQSLDSFLIFPTMLVAHELFIKQIHSRSPNVAQHQGRIFVRSQVFISSFPSKEIPLSIQYCAQKPDLMSLYFASKQSDVLVIFKQWSPGSLKVFENVSLGIGCFFAHWLCCPHAWILLDHLASTCESFRNEKTPGWTGVLFTQSRQHSKEAILKDIYPLCNCHKRAKFVAVSFV